jgi:site-specific DNA recombinase
MKDMETNTAAIYLRKSTEDEGKSVAAQERQLRIKAEQLEIDIVAVYREDDGTSASSVTNHDRPQFNRCLADYQAGVFKTIMVWDIDRWSRKGAAEVGQLLDLLAKHNGRLVDMGMDTKTIGLENARIPLLIKAEIARTEVVNSQKRILRGKETQRLNGAWLGGQVPYGLAAVRSFDAPTYLVIDSKAVANIKLMANWIIEGYSATEVAHKLNAMGERTSRNSPFNYTSVLTILRSPHLIGHRRYKMYEPGTQKIIGSDVARDIDGNPLIITEPILDEVTFARVNSVVADRRYENREMGIKKRSYTQKSLVGGLLSCATCHSRLRSQQRTKGTSYYRCGYCQPEGNSIPADLIEDYLADSALSLLATLKDSDPIIEEVGRRWMMQFTANDVSRRNELRGHADTIQSRIDKLHEDFYVNARIKESKFRDMETDLIVKLAPIEAELATFPEPNSDVSPLFDLINSGEDLDAGLTGEGSAWAALEHHVRRSILRCIIESVKVTPGEKGKPGENMPERCIITFATADNSPQLAGRTGRILGNHLNHKSKVLATN